MHVFGFQLDFIFTPARNCFALLALIDFFHLSIGYAISCQWIGANPSSWFLRHLVEVKLKQIFNDTLKHFPRPLMDVFVTLTTIFEGSSPWLMSFNCLKARLCLFLVFTRRMKTSGTACSFTAVRIVKLVKTCRACLKYSLCKADGFYSLTSFKFLSSKTDSKRGSYSLFFFSRAQLKGSG